MKTYALTYCFALILILVSCKTKETSLISNSAPAKEKTTNPALAIEGLNLGNKAPEIMMASPKGNVVTLSSLKGHLVLVDFWASWCGPCRAENPVLVAAYTKFHTQNFKNGNGFEILSVSLDQSTGAWEKAIEKDKLTWPSHVSDLQGWNNAAALKYGVVSIPTNLLVDQNGIIIAKNLREEALEKTLATFLKN